MPEGDTVFVRAIQTRFTNADNARFPEPYTRIIAVETANELAVCAGLEEIADVATRMAVRFADAGQAERFIHYFSEVIASNDTTLPSAVLRKEADYNCHSFAQVVAGAMKRRSWERATEWVRRNLKPQETTPPIALGRLAYLVARHGPRQARTIEHSVVGMGHDADVCLSVLGVGGPVAIATYRDVQSYYAGEYVVDQL